MVKMNGALRAPPLTAPPGLALRSSRRLHASFDFGRGPNCVPWLENKKLRQISADYTRVKRVFGPERVAAAVEADKQREQAEKNRKRPRRSLDRGGR